MGVCSPCRQDNMADNKNLNTDEYPKPSTSQSSPKKPKKNIHYSFHHLVADPRDRQVIVTYDETKCPKKPMRWRTYNPAKQQKQVPQVKHMTEKSGILEEGKESGCGMKDSLNAKTNNFLHFKTTIGIGRSQIIRTLNINTNSKKVPIITLDSSNLVLENKGKIKDTYKVIGCIGRGAFGEVHKIMDVRTKKFYALKTINKTNYEEVSDILNEIKILKSLVI